MTNCRRARIGVTAIVCLLLTFPLRAEPPVVDRVQVEFVAISSVDGGGIDLRLGVSGIARTTVTLTQVVIDDLTVGGIQLAAPTVSGPVTLNSDEPIRGLDDLSVRLSYSDVPSLTPLRNIVRDGHARLQATIRGRPSLNFVERLVLMGRETIVLARVDQDVTVTVPGGLAGLLILESTLAVAEPVWGLGRRVASVATNDEARIITFDSGTVALETRYQLLAADGVVKSITRTTAGFRLDDRTVLATAESVEPWVFDPVVARGLRDRSLRLVDRSREIYLVGLPVSDNGPTANDTCGVDSQPARIAKTLNARVQAFAHPRAQPFELRLRDTSRNVALLELRGGSFVAAPHVRLHDGSGWQPVAIPRACGAGFVRTSIRWDGRRYQIRDRVAADQFGAPMVTDRGIVGMVQDERSGVRLVDVLPQLGWQARAHQ